MPGPNTKMSPLEAQAHDREELADAPALTKKKSRRGADAASHKRRCVSTACIACRKRKSKCDGAMPSCAACASVYSTECVYDPNSDHRRKGVYREKTDPMKVQSSTLQIIVDALLNSAEEDVPALVKTLRTCDNLDTAAESIAKREFASVEDNREETTEDRYPTDVPIEGERDLARKMGELRLENGSVRFIGGTSHLIYLGEPADVPHETQSDSYRSSENPVTSWSDVTKDAQLIIHLMNMYFDWHYPYFTTLSKSLFYRDFVQGRPSVTPNTQTYCSPLLVNAMLSLGCHFTNIAGAFALPGDGRTKGDHFFAEAKRLLMENDEHEKPRLTTVQALALMSVREAGCGREAKGWVYSGMSFRMAQDIGLNLDLGGVSTDQEPLDEQEIDARRVTFWGCFLFDKCWSNYLGRLPQMPTNSYNVPKYDVFPNEDAELWSPYTDAGYNLAAKQPSRTRAVGLQLSKLCEISSDLLLFFYHPNHIGRSSGKAVELKKLSEVHRRLESWRKELPKELEPRDGQLPNVILVHMFFHLQYIHLFRPFLKYSPETSPLPAHVSPRRMCTANAAAISKLMRLYKKTYGLRQICNIAVYMVHSACTIHMLNLPEKAAKRDIIHGVKHLEEVAEDWPCARRTLCILSVLARKWKVDLPDEASAVLLRADETYGTFSTSDVPSPTRAVPSMTPSPPTFHTALSAKADQYRAVDGASEASAPRLPMEPPTTTMFPEMSSSIALAGQPSIMQGQVSRSMTHPVSNQGMSMTDGRPAVSSWTMPTAPQPIPSYLRGFQPAPHSGTPSTQNSRNVTRQVSPTSLYAIDGQEWYLKDGANWQQNFESWGMGPSSNPNSAISNPDPHAPLFAFTGFRADCDGSLDSLNNMNNLDHLPGLD